MLALVSSTDPRWVDVALGDLDAVLVDHLHCELKAASNATALVTRYVYHPRLVRELAELAREELSHVGQVHDELARRGLSARPPDEDAYARALRRALDDRKGEPLLDRLDPREKRILLLRFFKNMTQSQIAEEIGVSQMHVSRILRQTLERLREAVREQDGTGAE